MADNRIYLKCGEDEIVLAVCHGGGWRGAIEDRNDIGIFLSRNAFSDDVIKISFDDGQTYTPQWQVT